MTLKNKRALADFHKRVTVYPVEVTGFNYLKWLKWLAVVGSFVSYGLIAIGLLLAGFIIGVVVSLVLIFIMLHNKELQLTIMYSGFLILNIIGIVNNL